MATLIDRPLAAAGWLAYSIRRLAGGSLRAPRYVALGLLAVSAVPIFLVSTSPRPTDLTFEDMRQERIPAMTSWGRLEGELLRTESAFGGLYELHDTKDPALYVIVITTAEHADLAEGHAMITGRVSPRRAASGNVGSIDADIQAVPRVDEPIWLYLTPAVIAVVIAIGIRLGYPVIRGDRRSDFFRAQVADGEQVPVRWSGRIGSEVVDRAEARAASLAVTPALDASDMDELVIADDPGRTGGLGGEAPRSRTTRLRHHASVREVRMCRVRGADPALEIHPAAADVLLTFPDRLARDRLVARLL